MSTELGARLDRKFRALSRIVYVLGSVGRVLAVTTAGMLNLVISYWLAEHAEPSTGVPLSVFGKLWLVQAIAVGIWSATDALRGVAVSQMVVRWVVVTVAVSFCPALYDIFVQNKNPYFWSDLGNELFLQSIITALPAAFGFLIGHLLLPKLKI